MKKFSELVRLIAVFVGLFCLASPLELFAQRLPTLGERDSFQNGVSYSVSSARLSDDKVIIVYKDGSSSSTSNMYAIVGTVSGSNISYGTPVFVNDSTRTFITVVAFSSTKAVVLYEKYLTSGDKIKY